MVKYHKNRTKTIQCDTNWKSKDQHAVQYWHFIPCTKQHNRQIIDYIKLKVHLDLNGVYPTSYYRTC